MSSIWRTLSPATRRDIALVCLADAMAGVSFGAITTSGGWRPWMPVAMSLLVFAGGAQFAAAGVVLSGGGPLTAVVAGLVVNTRMIPYGFVLAEEVGRPWWRRLLGAHLVIDESLAFALREHGPRARRAAFWICGATLFGCWNAAVAVGALAGRSLRDTSSFGLDAMIPTVLLALVLPSLADRRTRAAAVAGAVIAVAATPFLPAGVPVLLALAGLALACDRAHGPVQGVC